MQGTKIYQETLFNNFQLSRRVPQDNFYRRLSEILDLEFLRNQTKIYYVNCGQKSLDPVVFFKFCLLGYLENITSDRKLVLHCSLEKVWRIKIKNSLKSKVLSCFYAFLRGCATVTVVSDSIYFFGLIIFLFKL